MPQPLSGGALALLGFLVIGSAPAVNMILARGMAGEVPPFSFAFFRWSIVALGLLPFAIAELRAGRLRLPRDAPGIAAAGFLGMFLCGFPVYMAGATTTAINIGLIMALSPLVVLLLSRVLGLEHISRLQVIGMALALTGALVTISRGNPHMLAELKSAPGDLLMLVAMLGWSGYTLVQSRVGENANFLGRVSVFAAAGALFTFPFAAHEMWTVPQAVFTLRAAGAYVIAGLVPGLFAYGGFAYLVGKFGAARASVSLYIGPIAGALLSSLILNEPPGVIHLVGGALILGGVWASLRR
jgi:drug/metabolite transporter (DMT)-like permease